ncbi:MAG: NADH-quinone oxidoreductase subunit C [Anaerolineae bacterium]|nr:NADH-quinone oxidoreductase subunit C [Anaerolineae bacterium]
MMQIPAPLDPVAEIQDKFADATLHVKTFRDETTIIVSSDKIIGILLYLRNTPGLVYNFLSDISAVDYFPDDYGDAYEGSDFRPERFAVSYHLYSMLYNRRLRVKTFATAENPTVPSLTENNVWTAANWLEREVMDLMGITFARHPDPRRLLMPDDWDGHPQRRDYPLGKETVAFSFNIDEIHKHKPFAED